MSQKKENKPCNGQFSKEAGQQKKGRKQNSGFGAGRGRASIMWRYGVDSAVLCVSV